MHVTSLNTALSDATIQEKQLNHKTVTDIPATVRRYEIN